MELVYDTTRTTKVHKCWPRYKRALKSDKTCAIFIRAKALKAIRPSGLLMNNINSDLREMMRCDRVDGSASLMNTVFELRNSIAKPGLDSAAGS